MHHYSRIDVQKAGFMLVEVSFAKTVNERRHVVIIVRQTGAFNFGSS